MRVSDADVSRVPFYSFLERRKIELKTIFKLQFDLIDRTTYSSRCLNIGGVIREHYREPVFRSEQGACNDEERGGSALRKQHIIRAQAFMRGGDERAQLPLAQVVAIAK